MKTKILAIAAAILMGVGAEARLTVHEWGTFTSVVGSDGRAQHGMYHEDEALPDFVHSFGEAPKLEPLALRAWGPSPVPTPHPIPPRCPRPSKLSCDFLIGQTITQKMETPVVYFYSDREQKVRFDVSFPQGIISQSYPAPLITRPEAIPGVTLVNGFASYEVEILKNTSALPPAVAADNIYAHARNVASDLIRSGSEIERFIFYRGLGQFSAQLKVTSDQAGLRFRNLGTDAIPHAFLIFTTDDGGGSVRALGAIAKSQSFSLAALENLRLRPLPKQEFIAAARTQIGKALTSSGLHSDEAKAMLDTWEHGYFQTPGLRVLYVLNRAEVESILPAQVQPTPERFERVFVGRIEVLTAAEEKQMLSAIRAGVGIDTDALGSRAEAILRRLLELAQDTKTRARIEAAIGKVSI